MLTNIVAS
jgi:hypothetical protein